MSIGRGTRWRVFERDGFTCQYCGKKAPDVILEVDHVHPRSRGGSDDLENLVAACKGCNGGKSARPLERDPLLRGERRRAVQLMCFLLRELLGQDALVLMMLADLRVLCEANPIEIRKWAWAVRDEGIEDAATRWGRFMELCTPAMQATE